MTPLVGLCWGDLLDQLSPWCAVGSDTSSSSPESDLSTPHDGSLQGEDTPMFSNPGNNSPDPHSDYVASYQQNLWRLDWQDAEVIRKVTEEGVIEAAMPLLYSF
jgi:hypothetical protein